jgi:hypothetical protein
MDSTLFWICVGQAVGIMIVTWHIGKRLSKMEDSITQCQLNHSLVRLKMNILQVHYTQSINGIYDDLGDKVKKRPNDTLDILAKMQTLEDLLTKVSSQNSEKTSS